MPIAFRRFKIINTNLGEDVGPNTTTGTTGQAGQQTGKLTPLTGPGVPRATTPTSPSVGYIHGDSSQPSTWQGSFLGVNDVSWVSLQVDAGGRGPLCGRAWSVPGRCIAEAHVTYKQWIQMPGGRGAYRVDVELFGDSGGSLYSMAKFPNEMLT